MAKVQFFVAVLMVLTLLLVPSATKASDFFDSKPAAQAQAVPGPFDYFRLALTWPPSHCNGRNPPCKVTPLPQNFTIHGLWPDNFIGPFLRACLNDPLRPLEVPLVLLLAKDWPDLQGGHNVGFWSYEWLNHGTCSLNLYDQENYFYLAINLRHRYDVIDALKRSSIVPGTNLYTVTQFSTVIQQLTSKAPAIACKRDSAQRELLHEIHICFTPIGAAIDCPPTRLSTASRCSSPTARIHFPT